MKILCSADWHLDAPMAAQDEALRQALLSVPGQVAEVCRREQCDLVLLAGDLFDGPYTEKSLRVLTQALADMAVPVFISPGNHDFLGGNSPWNQEIFPENVHIFKNPRLEAVRLGDLTVYGAGYTSMDCPALLENFRAEENSLCVLHADPTAATSAYCPVSRSQVENSNLKLLALGHIHKAGAFTAGSTLCLWPGCPAGRGYDETGPKGVYVVELADSEYRFIPLENPRFFDLSVAADQLDTVLPAAESQDYYRVTLTGACQSPDLEALSAKYAHIPHLTLRDRTVAPLDIWGSAGDDSFEGVYFGLLRQAMDSAPDHEKEIPLLAAKLSRQLLTGQEVALP